MDALGINPVIVPTQTTRSAPVLPRPAPAPTIPSVPTEEVRFDAKVAEQRRFERVQQAARDVANVYIVSDRRFTIFKDATGQYITRFTSLRDGRVTYIPEPDLLRLSGSGRGAQTVSIEA